MAQLALDTATEECSLALGESGRLIEETSFNAGRNHLELLLEQTRLLLERNKHTIADLDALVAGIGPGTFSGLRIGVATARGLAQALAVPLWGSDTLGALAAGIAAWPGRAEGPAEILAVIDARRKQVFARLFQVNERGLPQALSEIVCMEPDGVIEWLREKAGGQVIAAGNGVRAHFEVFSQADQVRVPDAGDAVHRVSSAYHLSAARRMKLPRGSDGEIYAVLPLYVREPDADRSVLSRKQPWAK